MRTLLRRTTALLFGAGGTQGGVKKVTGPTFTYSDWLLGERTRNLVAPIHHPLVTEYFLRLNQKQASVEKWQEEQGCTPDAGRTLANKVDGSPFDFVQWSTTYRDELDTAHRLATLLLRLDENVIIQGQVASKAEKTPTDSELLEMVKEDINSLLDDVRALDEEVDGVMRKRLGSADLVGSASSTWTVTVTGKAGGEEASLFAAELAEMFKIYGKEFRGFDIRDAGRSADDGGSGGAAGGGGAGSSSGFQFNVTGDSVYRHFHHEIGVHKVQRVPVTDAAGKMQTSTATVTMMPVLDPLAVNVHESDCKIDYVRGSGPGGQGMQSSSNCVVLTHLPSGITVKCHQSRSALGNKELALQLVAQQILSQRVRDQNSLLYEAWKNQWSSGERSDKMRTYNYPQNRVTDHRLGKDYSLTAFMERGSGLVGLHDELNQLDDLNQLCTVLLKHIEGDFGSKV